MRLLVTSRPLYEHHGAWSGCDSLCASSRCFDSGLRRSLPETKILGEAVMTPEQRERLRELPKLIVKELNEKNRKQLTDELLKLTKLWVAELRGRLNDVA